MDECLSAPGWWLNYHPAFPIKIKGAKNLSQRVAGIWFVWFIWFDERKKPARQIHCPKVAVLWLVTDDTARLAERARQGKNPLYPRRAFHACLAISALAIRSFLHPLPSHNGLSASADVQVKKDSQVLRTRFVLSGEDKC